MEVSFDGKVLVAGEHAFDLGVCISPTCGCSEMGLLPREKARSPRTLSMDPFERKVAAADDSPEEAAVALALEAAVSDGQWTTLAAAFMAEKERIVAQLDPDAEDFEFDFDAIQRRRELTYYADVFPYANPWPFEASGRFFNIDEAHCLAPDCACTSAILAVFAPDDATDGEVHPTADLWVDHRTGQWGNPDGSPLSKRDRALRDALLAAHPHLLDTLADHQRVLRRMFHQSASRRGLLLGAPPRAPAATKVGRNEPCPCGSGKKYKKCCLM